MNLSGIVGRALYALFVGVITFLVVWILGAIIVHFEAAIGAKVEQFAPLIGLLAGLVQFFAGSTNWFNRGA